MAEGNAGTAVAVSMEERMKVILDPIRTRVMASLAHTTVKPERLIAAFETAVARDPGLLKADKKSLQVALLQCAQDGLLPDGRRAAIVVYRTNERKKDAKGAWQDNYIQKATYLPMVQGIISRAREMGEIINITSNVVYANDKFEANEADPESTQHERAPLGTERGAIIGAYAIFRDKHGVVHREIMDKAEIDKTRGASKAANSPAWKEWFGEMARKTVIRRGAKYVPMSDSLRLIIEREDQHVRPEMIGRVERGAAAQVENYNPLTGEALPPPVEDDIGEDFEGETIEGEAGAADDAPEPADDPASTHTFSESDRELLAAFEKDLNAAGTEKMAQKAGADFREAFDALGEPMVTIFKRTLAARLDALRTASKKA